MKACDKDHDQIIYDGDLCPLCCLIDDKDEEIGRLTAALESAQKELASLAEWGREVAQAAAKLPADQE